jgi:serine protease Do
VKIDGSPVDSPNKLSRLIGALTPGATAHIEVVRDGNRLILNIPLSERRDGVFASATPQTKADVKLGLDVQDLTPGLADTFNLRESKGALITKIEAGSLAQAEGLREGDLIKEVNRTEVASAVEFQSAISRLRRGDTILLRVLRESRAFYVVLKSTE